MRYYQQVKECFNYIIYHALLDQQQAFLNGNVPWYYSSATGNLNTGSVSFTLGTFQIYDAEGAWDIMSGIEVVKK